jgi:PAS domain S-box-containing protein
LENITNREKFRLDLEALSARSEAILESVPDIIVEVNNDKIYTWANQAGYDFFGNDILGKSADYYFEGEQDTYTKVQLLFDGGEDVFYVESWQRRQDGQVRLLAWWCRALKDKNGQVIGALSTARDVTDERQVQAALRQNEARLQSVFRVAPVGISILVKQVLTEVNDQFCEMTGYPRETLIGENIRMLFRKDEDYEAVGKEFRRQYRETGTGIMEIQWVRNDGQVIEVLLKSTPINPDDITLGEILTTLDITERKRIERSLQTSEAKYRNLVENAGAGVATVDTTGKLTYVNHALSMMVGYLEEELLGKPFTTFLHPEDLSNLLGLFQSNIQEPGRTRHIEFRLIHKNGEVVYCTSTPTVMGEQGEIQGMSAIIHNITDRIQAESALQQTHIELEKRVDARTTDLNLRIQQVEYLNRAMTNLLSDLVSNQHILEVAQDNLKQAHQMLKQERIEEQSILLNLSQSMLVLNEPESVMDLAVNEAMKALDTDFCDIVLIDPERKSFAPQAWVGWPTGKGPRHMFPLDRKVMVGEAILDKAPLAIPDIGEFPRNKIPPFVSEMGIIALLIVPLIASDQVIGALIVHQCEYRQWTEDEISFLSLIANITAQALERARLFSQVKAGRERLQVLSRRLIDIQEGERYAVARELHDQVGQILTALKLQLQTVAHLAKDSRLAPNLTDSIEMADRVMQRVRSLSRDLRPSVLDDFGLEPALRWHLDQQAQWGGFAWSFEADLPEARLPEDLETVCFRIAQAAITNIVQHANAKQVDLKIWIEDGELWMDIRDDGIGFNVTQALERAAQGETLGLLGLMERAELLGGLVEIESESQRGTRIRSRLPYDPGQIVERRRGARMEL